LLFVFFFSLDNVDKDKVFHFSLIYCLCFYRDFIFLEGVVMIPMEPPMNEQQGPLFYHPAPPPMGYPPPPTGNPYAVPPQNYDGTFNPYPQQYHQMPYPPQQQAPNLYQVKEGKKTQDFV
jgi:hypothetical protein